MRNGKTGGFTLIELLIVIAIIGILAAVLIPNLLNARSRAFDTAAQTCLKELATLAEVYRSDSPFEYPGGTATGAPAALTTADLASLNACASVNVAFTTQNGTEFEYRAYHDDGRSEYVVSEGTGVTRRGASTGLTY